MPGARRTRKGMTQVGKNSRAPLGEVWDKTSAVQEFDGRVNTQAGDKGKEPGGRFSPAYYESGRKIITRDTVKDVD